MKNAAIPMANVQGNWRFVPTAPGLKVYQALGANGQTASGAGDTRSSAYLRCKGELAEIEALNVSTVSVRQADVWTGVASGPSADETRARAALEAIERMAVDLWWHGVLTAREMTANPFVATTEAMLRLGQTTRDTVVYLIDPFAIAPVAVALSMDARGANLIPGYGAGWCHEEAKGKALREMAMMELNLFDARPAQRKRIRWIRQKISLLHPDHCSALYGDPPNSALGSDGFDQRVNAAGFALSFRDISVRADHQVWIARLAPTGCDHRPVPRHCLPIL
ncbi:MAG: YcaO-like family protein [Sulfitobacter sp.]